MGYFIYGGEDVMWGMGIKLRRDIGCVLLGVVKRDSLNS